MSYEDAVTYLYGLRNSGIKFGLENMQRLMEALGSPHTAFPAVHVAGTNGKGSTSAIIGSILQAAGFKVGLFTSPHLISFTERIRINGEEITEDGVVFLAEEIRKSAERLHDVSPTFFEVVTAMALLFFKREMIDIGVMEVGMGGRLDATNIIVPAVSVITNISPDHTEYLGDTLTKIACEKAGIIKESVPVVTSHQEEHAAQVLEAEAGRKNAVLFSYGRDFTARPKRENSSGMYFDFMSDSLTIRDLFLPLIGKHQIQNASVAVKAIELMYQYILKHPVSHQPPADMFSCIRDGLGNVRWPGRFEFINDEPPVIIDGAHNPSSAAALSAALKMHFLERYKTIIIILGIMGDKDIKGIMEPLLPLATEIIFTAPSCSRAASPEKLAEVAKSSGFQHGRIAPTVKEAFQLALAMKTEQGMIQEDISGKGSRFSAGSFYPGPLILITGSFYTIGEAKEALGQRGVLTGLRE